MCVLRILTFKCASPHNRVHFFDISTSKSVPNLRYFWTRWLRRVLRATMTCKFPKVLMTIVCALRILTAKCASRHNRVHFFQLQHLNFQKCSEHKFLYVLIWKRASRHNCVQPQRRASFNFSYDQIPRWLRARRFCEPTFRSYGVAHLWQNTLFHDFSTFWRALIFFLLSLSLLWSSFFFLSLLWLVPPFLLHLSILSEVWLLNFLQSK